MTKAQLNAEIHNLPKSTIDEHGIYKQSKEDKKKILKLLYNIQQAKSIKAAPKLLKGNYSRYKDELSNFSTSKPTEKRYRRGSFNLKKISGRSAKSVRLGGGVRGFILRGGKKTLRKKRRKKQKNKKITRKRFI